MIISQTEYSYFPDKSEGKENVQSGGYHLSPGIGIPIVNWRSSSHTDCSRRVPEKNIDFYLDLHLAFLKIIWIFS